MLLGGTWKVSWTVLKEHSNLSNSYLFDPFFCNNPFCAMIWHLVMNHDTKTRHLAHRLLTLELKFHVKHLIWTFQPVSGELGWTLIIFFYSSVKFNFLSGVDEVKNLNHGLQIRPRTRSRFLLIFSYFGWKFLQNCIWNEQNSRMIRNVDF